jgi:hypothetical protein
MASFVEKLDAEGLQFFNDTCKKQFSEQAVAFLNAYWDEIGDQAEFIFGFAWETIKYADMHAKGCNYVHLYEEGNDLDYNIGLYFYEQLCKRLDKDSNANKDFKEFNDDRYQKSFPVMMTAIDRKKELKKVDVNFDNRISMLEYLLDQYKSCPGINAEQFVTRSMKAPDEHPEIKKARLALEEVNKRIKAYEAEKQRLEEQAALPGVKGLKGKNLLAQLDASPLVDELNKALITAEAAVRIVSKKFGKGGSHESSGDSDAGRTEGAVWWMQADMAAKQKKYGKKK